MNLFLFEFRKIFFSKKFIYLLLLLVIGIAFLFVRNVTFQSYIEKEEARKLDIQTKASQANSRVHRLTLENDPENELALKLQPMNAEIQDQLYKLVSVPTQEWEKKLTMQNEILANTLAYKNEGGDYPISEKEITEGIALNEKLLQEGIQPQHNTYSIAMPNFVKMIVDLFINFGALLIFILIIGETLSGEYENHSINLLFSQPLKKTRIIMSKFWSAVVIYIIMMGVILLSATAIGFVFGEKGTFNYPILIEKNHELEFLSIASYTAQGLLLVSVMSLMLISLYLVYSLLFKHTLATLAALIVTFAIGYALSTFITWGSFAWFNPFLNIYPSEMLLNQNNHDWYQAIPITLLLAVVLYWLAAMKIKTSKIG